MVKRRKAAAWAFIATPPFKLAKRTKSLQRG
jgi:hypothetical protein